MCSKRWLLNKWIGEGVVNMWQRITMFLSEFESRVGSLSVGNNWGKTRSMWGGCCRSGLQFLQRIGVWRSTFFLQSSCLCVWVPAVWLGRLRECAWKWLGPAMTLQFWWGRRLPSYSWNVRMHVFSFPVLVATSVSFPLSLHFLYSFMIAYCSATDRILPAFAQKENWLLRREGKESWRGSSG